MNKAVIGVIGVVIIIGIIYAVFFLPKVEPTVLSFEKGVENLNGIWANYGFTSKDLTKQEKLVFIEESKLKALKADLISFSDSLSSYEQTNDRRALEELVHVELELVDNAILRKDISSTVDFLESINYDPDEICNNLAKINGLIDNVSKEYSLAGSYNDKREAFNSNYPDKISFTGLEELETNADTAKINDLKSSLNEFKTHC